MFPENNAPHWMTGVPPPFSYSPLFQQWRPFRNARNADYVCIHDFISGWTFLPGDTEMTCYPLQNPAVAGPGIPRIAGVCIPGDRFPWRTAQIHYLPLMVLGLSTPALHNY